MRPCCLPSLPFHSPAATGSSLSLATPWELVSSKTAMKSHPKLCVSSPGWTSWQQGRSQADSPLETLWQTDRYPFYTSRPVITSHKLQTVHPYPYSAPQYANISHLKLECSRYPPPQNQCAMISSTSVNAALPEFQKPRGNFLMPFLTSLFSHSTHPNHESILLALPSERVHPW